MPSAEKKGHPTFFTAWLTGWGPEAVSNEEKLGYRLEKQSRSAPGYEQQGKSGADGVLTSGSQNSEKEKTTGESKYGAPAKRKPPPRGANKGRRHLGESSGMREPREPEKPINSSIMRF